MATKTFKIGEYAKNAVIATQDKVTIISKEWDFSAGSNKNSNQSNAKEAHRIVVDPYATYQAETQLLEYLCEETSSFYANKILNWIKTNVKFSPSNIWIV